MKKRFPILLAVALTLPAIAAPPESLPPVVDLRKESVAKPESDYHLGPTGMRGWMHRDKGRLTSQDMSASYSTARARQILVTTVEKGSPADGVMAAGDVILGIAGKPFSSDPRHAMAKAINEAEQHENGGKLHLLRWRSSKEGETGKTTTVILPLKALGTFSDTAPFNCPKTDAIRKQTTAAVYRDGMSGTLGLHALALMATGEKEDLEKIAPRIKRLGKQGLNTAPENIGNQSAWDLSYRAIILCEYYLLTGDEEVMPAVRDHMLVLSRGQSLAGDWGHKMSNLKFNKGRLNGRLKGYGAFNHVSLSCYLALMLGEKCGVEEQELTVAIRKSRENFSYYIGKGAHPYGYHSPRELLYGNNGTSAMAAIICSLQGNSKGAEFYSRLSAASAHEVEIGHTGAYFNHMWTALGANLGGPELLAGYIERTRWHQTMTRRWDGGFVYQQPAGGSRHYRGLDPNSANLLALCVPQKTLVITGKNADPSSWLSGKAADSTLTAPETDFSTAEADELLTLLGHELPPVRVSAARALAKREGDFIPRLQKMLDGTRDQRIGACHALGFLETKAASASDELMDIIRDVDGDPWIRIRALSTLEKIGDPARKHVPELMQILIDHKQDGQRRLLEVSLGTAISQLHDESAADGPEKPLRHRAAIKLLDHPHSWGRTLGMRLINDLSLEDFHLFAEKIVHVCLNDDPSYTHYTHDGARAAGLAILERLSIEEGLELCVKTLDPNLWGQKHRLPGRLKLLEKYGANAKPHIPEIRRQLGKQADEVIAKIEQSDTTRKLIPMAEAIRMGDQSR